MAALAAAILAGGGAAARAEPPGRAELSPAPAAGDILVMLRLSPEHLRPDGDYGGDYGDGLGRNARRRLAGKVARRHGLEFVGDGWPMPLLGLDCYVMRVPANADVEAAAAEVSRDPRVAWSQPLHVFQARGDSGRPGDPLFEVQPAARAWRLGDLHRVATGRGMTVAVVDSRIEVDHPDLSGQFAAIQDFVTGHPDGAERHGTAVAGVIAARQGNGVGIVGVAPEARLMALRACWQAGGRSLSSPTFCDSLSLAKAIHFAIDHHAAVINLSLAGPPDRLLGQLLEVAAARRISVVAAYDPSLPKGGFPASEPGVIGVADQSLVSLPEGVYGAPGRDVPTTQPGGQWSLVNGSSFAAAHVSGLLALVREDRSSAPGIILVSAQPKGGSIDACATVLRVFRNCRCSCPAAAEVARAVR